MNNQYRDSKISEIPLERTKVKVSALLLKCETNLNSRSPSKLYLTDFTPSEYADSIPLRLNGGYTLESEKVFPVLCYSEKYEPFLEEIYRKHKISLDNDPIQSGIFVTCYTRVKEYNNRIDAIADKIDLVDVSQNSLDPCVSSLLGRFYSEVPEWILNRISEHYVSLGKPDLYTMMRRLETLPETADSGGAECNTGESSATTISQIKCLNHAPHQLFSISARVIGIEPASGQICIKSSLDEGPILRPLCLVITDQKPEPAACDILKVHIAEKDLCGFFSYREVEELYIHHEAISRMLVSMISAGRFTQFYLKPASIAINSKGFQIPGWRALDLSAENLL